MRNRAETTKDETRPRETKRSRANGSGAKGESPKARAPKRSDGKARARPKRNGARMPEIHALPPPEEELLPPVQAPRRRNTVDSETEMRFRLASFVRLSDNLVSRAVRAYDSLFDIDRDQKAEIYLDMGREFARAGKNAEAISSFRKVIRIRPDSGVGWLELGRVYMRREALGAAEQAFRKAKELGEVDPGLFTCLSEILLRQGKDEEALRELEHCARLTPLEARVWYRLGFANDRLGRYDEAVEAFEQAIELEPNQPAYHQSMGFTYESMGRRKDAIACFKRALALEQHVLD